MRSNKDALLTSQVMIPELIRSVPGSREVLDRYGLRGCGGPEGPHESLEFFARAHDVPIDQLLDELRKPDDNRLPVGEHPPSRWSADAIYRPFFLAGIAVVLTLGAVWGAYLLVRIALAGKFTAVGLHEVNAHGHAQIFGWVGLFVMGFAYQAFPRFKHTTLSFPGLAWLSFALMLGGLLVRSVLEPLADGFDTVAALAVAATTVEVVAIGLFVFVITSTWRASGKKLEVYDWYIASALFWFVAQAVYETIYVAATFRAGQGELVPLVAAWQGALRDLQIHGFAALMILGVSQRMLPNMFGFPSGSRRLARWCLAGLNLAVVGEAAGLVLMRRDGRHWAGLWYLSVLTFAACVTALVLDWRVFGRAEGPDRSRKFVRTAYAWLLISLAMLIALPAYQFAVLPAINPESAAVKMGFSHAYYGATRHAITVGFISLMIVGVSSKVVPVLRGADPRQLIGLWIPFGLINLGCTLRVVGQTATDWADWVFPLAGVSGALEVAGLAVWAAHLAGLMLRRPGWAEPPVERRSSGPIAHDESVLSVIERYPELLPVFVEHGFRPLANPFLRRTLARGVSIEFACRLIGIDTATFLQTLNARLKVSSPLVSLPILAGVGHDDHG